MAERFLVRDCKGVLRVDRQTWEADGRTVLHLIVTV